MKVYIRHMEALLQKLMSKVTIDASGCWLWGGYRSKDGYGRTPDANFAHRVFYKILKGSLSKGVPLDHLCRNRACCNPDHLEIVTIAENNKRGRLFRLTLSHCKNGHEFTPENTVWIKATNTRRCRACNLESVKRYGLSEKGRAKSNEAKKRKYRADPATHYAKAVERHVKNPELRRERQRRYRTRKKAGLV